ncbi:hypothetical protein [Rubellimicrobium arenae]|uniref:hypothetical protein n=1 Tax=Rubellimicrobium arenae TaxID=2817372 RepID=UPI001B314FDB|nr:hypothetical protein [Rubellimicrobium arenae]
MSDLPLAELLSAIAQEIDGPRQAILWAEQHLAETLDWTEVPDGSAQDLQRIDLALQVLNDLEGFILRLGRLVPAELRVDATAALEALRLERVAVNLAAALGAPRIPTPHDIPVELF